MAKKPETHTFPSGEFTICDGERLHGMCVYPDPPDAPPERWLWVNPSDRGMTELDSWLHEGTHAYFLDQMAEEDVAAFATCMAGLLWKLGYRRKR